MFDVRDECRNYGATGTGNQSACTIQLADVDRNKAQNCRQTAAQVSLASTGSVRDLCVVPGLTSLSWPRCRFRTSPSGSPTRSRDSRAATQWSMEMA